MNFFKKYSLLITFLLGLSTGIAIIIFNRVLIPNNLIFAQAQPENEVSQNIDDDNYFKYFPMFSETYKILKREFYDANKVKARNLIYGAIKGMLESVEDPYTTFMDPETSKGFSTEMSGTFGGLGITIDIRDGYLTVVTPLEDTPAWKAGIKPGDRILEIDGVSTKNITTKEAIEKLRGNPGTKVTLKIEREGIKTPFNVTLIREQIKLQTVKSDIISTDSLKIGFIKVLEFSMPTVDDFRKNLERIMNNKLNGIIIDLRNNPGGLLSTVVNIVDFFQNEGLIVYTKGRTEENNSKYIASKETTIVPLDLPLVVLVNKGSASASEIFTGALKDTGRAVIVGTKTFGKGSVQKTYIFSTDGSLIKYTVARYFTPSGICIDKEGISPDVSEEMWLDKLSQPEKKSLLELQNTNIIRDFIEKNKKLDESDIKEFKKFLYEKGYVLGDNTVKYIIWMKKLEKTIPPVYNLEFDNQLTKAIEVIKDYQKYRKKYKVYFETK